MEKLDWNNLGFQYHDLPYSYNVEFSNENWNWEKGGLTTNSKIELSEAAQDLHYGQEIFEGLKAYRTQDNHINLFRPLDNARRFNNSADRLLMPNIPENLFLEAVKQLVIANESFVPPYGSGGSLYIRPFMIGTEPLVAVKASSTFIFHIYATPVGSYISGLKPMPYIVSEYDRVALNGTGEIKTAGNYASSLLPENNAKKLNYADCLFLDPVEHKYIDEFSGANFFGITKDKQFVTPKSKSILPSITKKSLLQIAQDLNLNPVEKRVTLKDAFRDFVEVGAMGTAAVISPVGSLTYKDKKHVFYSENNVGPITQKMYNILTQIQYGDIEDKHNWVVRIK